MKKLLLIALFLGSCMTPVYAQAESDPFPLAHPVTGEPGVWIPQWAQRLSLETDAKLKTCTETLSLEDKFAAEKNAEISERIAAYTALKDGLDHTQVQLIAVQKQLQNEASASHNRLVWALIATGGALVTGTILALHAVF